MKERASEQSGNVTYEKIPAISEQQINDLYEGSVIWKFKDTRVIAPNNPLSTEGIHLRVESKNVPQHPKSQKDWQGWLENWQIALIAGGIIAEGDEFPDIWTNFIGKTIYTPRNHLVTDVIGRVPTEASFGESFPFPNPDYDHRNFRKDEATINILREEFNLSLENIRDPYYQKAKFHIFSEEPKLYESGTKDFEKERKIWNQPMVVTDKFSVLALLDPHLRSGMHLMTELQKPPTRAWYNLQDSLEALAVAEMTDQILEEFHFNGKPFSAWGSNRITGSFFDGFQELKNSSFFLENYVPGNYGWLKERYKEKWNTGFVQKFYLEQLWIKDYPDHMFLNPKQEAFAKTRTHVHSYHAEYPDENIVLLKTPDLKGTIPPMPKEKRDAMSNVLQENLIPRLMDKVSILSTN